jgi:hypothetical protein
MTATHFLSTLAVPWLAYGLLFGLAYFALLRRTVGYCVSGRGYVLPATLTLARLAAAILFFGWATCVGELPALIALLGFLMARAFALRAGKRLA